MKYSLLYLVFVSAGLCGCPSEDATQTSPGGSQDARSETSASASDDVAAGQAPGDPQTDDTPPIAEMDSASAEDSAGQDDNASGNDDACCAAHDTPGCADAAIMDCVCADDVLPECCTGAWTQVCVEVVGQRYCDPGVRACVCDEWQQSGCCQSDWTQTFCDVVATTKCGATIGCAPQS